MPELATRIDSGRSRLTDSLLACACVDVPSAESELEVAFFRDLQKELQKISLFYTSEEKRCQSRFHQLRAVLKDLKVRRRTAACLLGVHPDQIKAVTAATTRDSHYANCALNPQRQQQIDAFEAQRLMFALVHFYRECIRLENFAVMNYQGFSKVRRQPSRT